MALSLRWLVKNQVIYAVLQHNQQDSNLQTPVVHAIRGVADIISLKVPPLLDALMQQTCNMYLFNIKSPDVRSAFQIVMQQPQASWQTTQALPARASSI
jgi:hypothetical protein